MKKLTPKNLQRNMLRANSVSGADQRGFIPMMLCILAVIAFIIFLVYIRVASVGH